MNDKFQNSKFRRGHKLFFIPFVILIALLLGAIVYWLWNAILPQIMQVKSITYPQAIGLLLLCRILFGGWGGRSNLKMNGMGFRDKLRNMTPEERQKLREEWTKRCRRQ